MNVIIGESGGTKTDWVIIKDGSIDREFTTGSLHPLNWTDNFFLELNTFWQCRDDLKKYKTELFVAGCFNPENANKLQTQFEKMGFHVRVRSDLHAAGFAVYGSNSGGKIAIMGTGSVVFDFHNGDVSNLIGGLGYLQGDEGSAYYFGKLLIEGYCSKTLNELQMDAVQTLFTDRIPDLRERFEVAQLAARTYEFSDLFADVHEQNIRMFIERHHLKEGDHIALVGSYAWFQKAVILSVFKQEGVKIIDVIERPISSLVDQIVAVIE